MAQQQQSMYEALQHRIDGLEKAGKDGNIKFLPSTSHRWLRKFLALY